MKWEKHDMAAIFKTFSITLRLLCSSLKVMTKSKKKFCLRPFVNPILSKHKICLNFMTKISTFKIFILDLRQNLDLRPFMNPAPGMKKIFYEKRKPIKRQTRCFRNNV